MDLTAYDAYFQGKLNDHELPQEELERSTSVFKDLPKPSTAKTGKW